jgi:multicomponent Na+:H+ antiporter subunit F
VFALSGGLLAVALLVSGAFVVRARHLVDRAIGLDLVMSVLVNGCAVLVAVTAGVEGVENVLLIGLLAFLGSVTVARFVERRGHPEEGP